MSPPRALGVVLAWVAAVVGATAIGLTAVGAIGDGIVGTPQRPLTADEVDVLLAAPPSGTAGPPAPSSPPQPVTAPAPAGPAPEVLASPGGTVVARCTDGVPAVVSATPAQGFRVDAEESGEHPDRVRFDGDEREVEVRLSCRDGRPVAEVREDGD